MPTEANEFWLYLGKISEQILQNFLSEFEHKHDNITTEVKRVDDKDAFFHQEENVVVAELGEIPHWQLNPKVRTVQNVALCL